MDGAVFRMKLQWILENAGEFVDLVFMSGLDFEGKTALHIAVANRFEEAVNSQIKAQKYFCTLPSNAASHLGGRSMNVRSKSGKKDNPIFSFYFQSSPKLHVKLLVSTAKVDLLATAGDNGWSALHTAVDLGDAKLTQLLLPTHNTTLTPHHVLSSLKQATASPYAVTALHMAVRRNSVPCAVMLLHTANALLNDHSSGWTSSEEELAVDEIQQKHHFHGQAGKGSRKLNKLKDRNGDTPLHWAVKTNKFLDSVCVPSEHLKFLPDDGEDGENGLLDEGKSKKTFRANFLQTRDRQQWAESKLLEEEVARRLERYLEAELSVLLKEREAEFNAEVERRVAIEREALEKRRKEEAERKAREEEEEKRRKEEEERQLKELNERLARQREEELSELRRKEEEVRQKQYEEELRKLEEKQRLEAEEQRRIKKEQEIILNRKRVQNQMGESLVG
ncbi:Reticulocyte-binding protein 2 a [Echinococcus granulosus]|uniref:Reticulocyte-binding protein 2 a n=1 Tax=Echinococcus granulosus TaxID=6210 RepID=W6U5R0_ECHGR|nr:Reticulocyte-binding protein 2 a [Echinococcus granulosus]EUB56498.1 Reticulocyte-binding protein 2 a [Echinococcus granulosus]